MVSTPSRMSRTIASLAYVMDYIGSPLGFALFISWLRSACEFSVIPSVICWMVVAAGLLVSVTNFVPAGIQAYRISLGYGRERRLRVWLVSIFAALSYAIASGGVVTLHNVWASIGAVVVNTTLTTALCTITHSTPRWPLRRY